MSRCSARPNLKMIGVVILAAHAILGAPSQAPAADKTQMTATIAFTSQADPERQWVESGILHIRSQPHWGAITGDLSGDVSNSLSVNVDLSTGYGNLWGTYVIYADGKSWHGRLSGRISPEDTTGIFVGRTADGERQYGTFDDVAGSGGGSFTLEWVASS